MISPDPNRSPHRWRAGVTQSESWSGRSPRRPDRDEDRSRSRDEPRPARRQISPERLASEAATGGLRRQSLGWCRGPGRPATGLCGREADDFVLGEPALPRLDDVAVRGDQDPGRLARDSERLPRFERLVPQQRERDVVASAELLGFVEPVLGAEADDRELFFVLLSKLLNPGSFPVANGSVWCPEPEQHRFHRRDEAGELNGLTVRGVEHFDRWKRRWSRCRCGRGGRELRRRARRARRNGWNRRAR